MPETKTPLGRRSFLRGAGVLAPFIGSLEALQAAQRPGARPNNIIFMVADGMSPSVLSLAEHFSQRVRGKGLLWRALIDRPEAARGLMDMASLNSVTTDSSAASSSWGSGSRIFNGWLNMLPDKTALTPIAQIARDRKKRVGLVTTTTITHATPAGFAAVQDSRGREEEIASQYLGLVDVLMGGGIEFFDPAQRKDQKDLAGQFRSSGYAFVSSRKELPELRGKSKILGLFSKGMIPFTLDRNNSAELAEKVPTLAEMTTVALEALRSSPGGFLLQVEGGRVDHAAHNNDAASMLWEQIAFDEAIEVALKFAERNPETLIVITSDHGNANPGTGGRSAEYGSSSNTFQLLAKAKCSYSQITPKFSAKAKPSAADVRELIKDAFSIEITSEEAEAVRASGAGAKRLCLNTRLDRLNGILGQVLGNYTGVSWVSNDHTSDYVLLTALGPGSQQFAGHLRNTRCFEIMTDYMGSSFRNPSMDLQRALQFRKAAALFPQKPHWV